MIDNTVLMHTAPVQREYNEYHYILMYDTRLLQEVKYLILGAIAWQ